MGERLITKGKSAPEPISRIMIASIVAVSFILTLSFVLAALCPKALSSAFSTVFTILVSVIGSGLISWYSSAHHSAKGFQKNLNQYAATAMNHIDYLSIANSTICGEVEDHIQWLTKSEIPGKDVLIEKFTRLKPLFKLMEAAVYHALIGWRNLSPERFEELESAIQLLYKKLREDSRHKKAEEDVDALKSNIAAAKTDDEKREFAREVEQKELEKEKIRQEVASELVMPPSGFYTATATIPIQPLETDAWNYARRYYHNYPRSE
jgi:hypothetical protein